MAFKADLITWRTQLQHARSVFCTRCIITTTSNSENDFPLFIVKESEEKPKTQNHLALSPREQWT